MSYKKAIKQNIKKVVNSSYPLVNNLYFKSFLKEHHEEIQKRNEFKKELAGETILVLAPHVDDETIGCGGALLQYVKRGKKSASSLSNQQWKTRRTYRWTKH